MYNQTPLPMRKCNACKIEKPLDEFLKDKTRSLGYSYRCKICSSQIHKEKYYDKYLPTRRGKYNEYYKERYINKTEEEKAKDREYQKNWEKENKDKVAGYKRKYRKENPIFKLKENIRTRIYLSLQEKNKSISTIKLLGCSSEEYKLYLEKQFDENMNWENYGTYWEIDHKKELYRFDLSNPIQQKEAFHFTNTQPLSIEENRKKR
jgi:hypothetical protein